MKQVWIIHGGDSFSSYDAYLQDLRGTTLDYERLRPKQRWSQWITQELTGADVLTPEFPNRQNAQFDEWSLYFEKLLPFFSDDVRLVGHSLGAMFLAKYLHNKPLTQPVSQLVLLAGAYGDTTGEHGSFGVVSATGLQQSAREIHLLHSQDDPVVPYSSLEGFESDLPTATVHRFVDKHHFIEPTFPELLNILEQPVL